MPNTKCYISAYDQVNLYIMDLFNIGVLRVAITSDKCCILTQITSCWKYVIPVEM